MHFAAGHRQQARPLRLEHRLVLREDGVLEGAQLARRCESWSVTAMRNQTRLVLRLDRADEQRDLVAVAVLLLRQLGQHRGVGRHHLVAVVDPAAFGGQAVALRLPGAAAGGDEAGRPWLCTR